MNQASHFGELSREQERALGLAGVLQAAALVQQLARTGQTESDYEQATVQSIKIVDAPTTPDVYGGIAGLTLGLEWLRDKLIGGRSELDVEVFKYAVALTTLQRSLFRKKQYMDALVEGINGLTDLPEEELYDACAQIYMSAVSPLSPKIYVQGEQGYLQHEGVPERVRTLLLGGIRASVLWQQKGGGRMDVMLHRKRYRSYAAEFLALSDIAVH